MPKLIAANWKMNGLAGDSGLLVTKLAEQASDINAEVLICPPFTLLSYVGPLLRGTGFALGGQDCHFETAGAFTGDISARMLMEARCTYVIVGHSERRKYHNETSEIVSKKVLAAVRNGLTPIICVGETLEDRESGKYAEVVTQQLDASIPSELKLAEMVVAYEPIWAIGTGKVAKMAEIEEMHRLIREKLNQDFSNNSFRVIYGGSVSAQNSGEILNSLLVDGALVGGASLEAEGFLKILKSV